MRWANAILRISLLILGMASPALAADYDLPILRGSSQPPAPVVSVGPATFTRWSGFYFGGNVSFSGAQSDFSRSTQPLFADSFRNLTLEADSHPSTIRVLGSGAATALGGGAFLGYNTQWQDLILSVEGTYTHTNLNMTASTSPLTGSATAPSRVFPGNEVRLASTGNLDLTDYGTARFRAGYVLGNLLPYGFVGMAVGRASYNVSTAAVVTQNTAANPTFPCSPSPTCQTFFFSNGAGQSNALLWGYTVGAGLDWMLTPNIFVRGEFEFVQFAPISSISVSMESGRVGGGFKF